jgi:hypothetical protein
MKWRQVRRVRRVYWADKGKSTSIHHPQHRVSLVWLVGKVFPLRYLIQEHICGHIPAAFQWGKLTIFSK